MASEHETSAKAFAEDLKALSYATEVLQVETGEPVVGMLEVVENDLSKNLAGLTLAEMRRRLLPEARAPEKGNQGLQETGREVPGAEEFWRKNQLASSPTTRKAHTPLKLNDICVAEAETYNEKVRQRFAEVARIKEALPILFESAFLKQRQALHWLQPRAQPILARYEFCSRHSDSDTTCSKPLQMFTSPQTCRLADSNILKVSVNVNDMNSVLSGSCQRFGS